MAVSIRKQFLEFRDWRVETMAFLPDGSSQSPSAFLWTHGYTSHKGSILNWAIRLAEEGRPGLIFDLPGHYLGSFNEVQNFEDFRGHAHELFIPAKAELIKVAKDIISEDTTWFLGGHSLGGLLSLKALSLPEFKEKTKAITVGLGLAPKNKVHLFDTPFYKSTLLIREQLVSPALNSDTVFNWIKKDKEELKVSNKEIVLITGEDDSVVGKDGTERLKELLEAQGNKVYLEKPRKLAHHTPELAAAHIKKVIKDLGY